MTKEEQISQVIDRIAEKTSQAMQFKSAFAQSRLPSAIVGIDGSLLEVNKAFAQMLGYSREELERLCWQELTCIEYLRADQNLVEKCLRGEIDGYEFFKEYIHKDGRRVAGELFVSLIRDGDKSFFLSQVYVLRRMGCLGCKILKH
jgi:PAS domain S-box-containing protein